MTYKVLVDCDEPEDSFDNLEDAIQCAHSWAHGQTAYKGQPQTCRVVHEGKVVASVKGRIITEREPGKEFDMKALKSYALEEILSAFGEGRALNTAIHNIIRMTISQYKETLK
jgi:hypothetical protein